LKKFLVLLILIPNLTFPHSGNTNAGGCHMQYLTANYHCHNKKYPSSNKKYWCINHMFKQYGPYSSPSSCYQAIRGSGISGICSPCR
tara:strand:+ start:882 stop:1142 length:261 start_codon:yes stop_codon:yes gene_type:complete